MAMFIVIKPDGEKILTPDSSVAWGYQDQGGKTYVVESLIEQAWAWEKIAKTLHAINPHWMELGGTNLTPADKVCEMLTDYLHILGDVK